MSRKPDWETALANKINSKLDATFGWGEHDCLMFTGECVEAITGKDFYSQYRGTYKTEKEAKAKLKELSEAGDAIGLMDGLAKRLPTVLSARRGDAVGYQGEDGICIGVCAGGGCMFVTPSGLIRIPLRMCFVAWRIY